MTGIKMAAAVCVALFLIMPTIAIKNHDMTEELSDVPFISAADAAHMREYVAFDTREKDAYQKEHVQDALSVPPAECSECLFDALDIYREMNILVYGADDAATADAVELLLKNGFERVWGLRGGLSAWKSCGLPTASSWCTQSTGTFPHATGCISMDAYDVENERERHVSITDIPPRWNWRWATYDNITGDWTTTPKSQGACGSCWDFAAMGALEAVINIRAKDPDYDIDLSEQYLLSCPTSSGGCSGWNAYWAYSYLLNHGGAIPEDCFPYYANDNIPCSEKCDDWRDHLFPITDFGTMRNPERDEIKSVLVTSGPVVAEMAVYGDFGSYDGGVYEHPGEEPASAINHQVVIVGYDDTLGCWICKNSWGTGWGENGFFRIAYGDCQIEHFIIYVDFSPAIARPGGPYYGGVGDAILFSGGESESLTSPIVSYLWDFGDGTTGSGAHPSHAYDREGKFVVRLTITDADGNQGTAKTTVYIDETPPAVDIICPRSNCFYFFGEEKGYMPFRTVIIGYITVSFSASDELSGLAKIEFYLDGMLLETINDDSFEWFWEGAAFGFHKMEVKAYDVAGNVRTETVKLWTWM